MNEIMPYSYPDTEIADLCEAKAASIRIAARTIQENIIAIGQDLLEVKAALPHGQFGPWLQARIGWSRSTATNYMNAARAVARNPKLWQFEPSVLYLLTAGTPESAVDELVERGPMPVAEAQAIVERHRLAVWEESCRERLLHGDAPDAGDVLHEIERALSCPLRQSAERLAVEHIGLLARLSDRDKPDLLAELGIPRNAPMAGAAGNRGSGSPGDTASGKASAQLIEDNDGCRLIVWIGGDIAQPYVIADFPLVRDPTARSWQVEAIDAAAKRTHARTLDHLAAEAL